MLIFGQLYAIYYFVTKSLLIRCLSITLNHGTNGWSLEIFKLAEITMPPSLLGLNSCPAYHQVEVLTGHRYDDNNDPSDPNI